MKSNVLWMYFAYNDYFWALFLHLIGDFGNLYVTLES